jgi:hypothetical protein
MKFTAQFNAPRLNLSDYRMALDRAMREAISQALMEWLNRVLDEIPDWTGASRATFVKLAESIGMGVTHNLGRAGQGIASSLGSKLELDTPPGHYTFTYQTTLPWLIWNEYHNANEEPDPTKYPPPAKLHKPGPYEFQAKGLMAFIQFAKSVDLPAVGPFIVSKKVRVG